MVHAFAGGTAAAGVLARQHGVALRVLDIAVDADVDSPPGVGAYKIRRGSGSIDVEDALSDAELESALAAGEAIAREEIAAGADLLILGDMGIGNTTPEAALIAATYGLTADEVVGRGTGIDDDALARKTAVLGAALERVGDRALEPRSRLQGLGSADLAAGVGFMIAAATAGVPLLLDGLATLAELSVADELAPEPPPGASPVIARPSPLSASPWRSSACSRSWISTSGSVRDPVLCWPCRCCGRRHC